MLGTLGLKFYYGLYVLVVTKRLRVVLRIVVPYRDYKKLRPVLNELYAKGYKPVSMRRDVLFEDRRDLDPLEIVFRLEVTPTEARRIKRKIAETIRGTLGFFLMYRERSKT